MKFVCFVFLILISCFVSGQNHLSFEHLSIEDGLANNSVRVIFQDKEGYLWFGTLNGLSRYDGQQFKTFDYNYGDTTSISNNKIRDIIQDGAGYIWVVTYDEHVHRFDPRTETFVNFPAQLDKCFSDCSIHFIYESSPGVMWLYLSGNGCVRIISRENTEEYAISYFDIQNSLPSNVLTLIQKGLHGGVWFCTYTGLSFLPDDRLPVSELNKDQLIIPNFDSSVLVLYETGKVVWVGCQNGDVFRIIGGNIELVWKMPGWGGTKNSVSFIEPTQTGQLCVGTQKGLVLIDEITGKTTHLTTRNSELNTSYVTSCYHDLYDDFWLVTSRRGVTRFQPKTRKFTYYPLHPEIRESILEGEKQIFLEDRNNDLWIGIYGGGISRFNRQSNQFEQYLNEEHNSGSLSSNLVLSIFEDQSGNLWTGTYKRGVNKINLQQTNFRSQKNSLGEVRAIFEDSRKWIWTGNRRGEVVVYDQNLQKKFSLDELFVNKEVNITSGIYAFEEDRFHNIWIGTKGNGIFILKGLSEKMSSNCYANLKLIHVLSNPDDTNSLSRNDVFDLHEDRNGQMWVALYHGGVDVIRCPLQPNQKILHYTYNDNEKYSISDNRIRCILEDNEGNIWIGTACGLNFLSREYVETENKKFEQLKRTGKSGCLMNNDIISIFQDSDSAIWIGTYGGGLNKLLDDSTFTFEHLGQAEGISSNIILSIVEDTNKNIWLGTDFGLCKYNRAENSFENYYVSDGLKENSFSEGGGILTSSNQLLLGNISGMIWFCPDSIRKSVKQVPVVFTNLLINGKQDKEKLNRSRCILGDSLQSLQLKYNENFLTFEFAALDFKDPSKVQYAFKLDNYEQHWNSSGNRNLAIYRELKAGEYLFRLKASNSDGLWVNDELQLSLIIDPPLWKTTWAYILYLLLATGVLILGRRIFMERIHLRHEVEFEKQLVDDKLKFYTSISHEFKTPLTLILGPVEDLLINKQLPSIMVSPLKMVKRNTHRLLELIDQLMDFRKIQKGFFRVDRVTGDVVQFLNEIYLAFSLLAEKQNISFSFKHEESALNVVLDFKSLEKIVFNLLSNAFKHTGSGEAIELSFEVDKRSSQLLISVSDEGDGINDDDLPHIFDRFHLGSHSHWKDESSTGIGLSLCKELVELQEGNITVKSKSGIGSCFTVMLPFVNSLDENASINNYADLDHTTQFIDVIEEEERQVEGLKEKSSKINQETVLVVEDNLDLQIFLVNFLSINYHVVYASNGKEGLELAKKENPDLIICDVMMPEMDGIELTRILKNEFNTSHIPIVLLTAKSLDEHKIEGIETGADDYITKPFNKVYLEKRIQNILKQRKHLRERFSRDLQAETKELSTSKADQEFINKVIRLAEEDMTDPEFSVESLLQHFSFGRTVFYKKMKGISGYSPKDFIRIIRMKKAAELLQDHDITVAEVAFDIGYNDPEYFSRLFKKHFGETPSEYKTRKKENRLKS